MLSGFNFAPIGWALCNGQLMAISQNTALFSLLGTYYGGDGRTTFALPDLRGRASIHQGQGQGLTPRVIGEESGEENVTLISTEMPMHTHLAQANSSANQTLPKDMIWGGDSTGTLALYSNGAPNSILNPMAIGLAGGSQPHNNMQPYLVMNYTIALEGVFPARN
jgi:microcystin-dependent protein